MRCRLCVELGSGRPIPHAGQYRLAAVKTLGHEHIDAYVIPRDVLDIEVELIEIDENLCRSDLTAAQRAQGVSRRQDLWEALQAMGGGAYGPQAVEPLPELGQAAKPSPAAPKLKAKEEAKPKESGKNFPTLPKAKTGRGNKQFAAETAALTGQSKSSINQQLARAAALGEDIKEVVGTSLDKGVELDALKELPVPERRALIARAKAGEKVSARSAKNSTVALRIIGHQSKPSPPSKYNAPSRECI